MNKRLPRKTPMPLGLVLGLDPVSGEVSAFNVSDRDVEYLGRTGTTPEYLKAISAVLGLIKEEKKGQKNG